jgi:hypothetical protein
MYIRIEFKNIDTEETRNTMELLYGSPNGTCLCSRHSLTIMPKEVREKKGLSVGFWYLDADVLNTYYGGCINALYHLRKYPGVASVNILPIKMKRPTSDDDYDLIESYLVKYMNSANTDD